jgi:hypothetical protein
MSANAFTGGGGGFENLSPAEKGHNDKVCEPTGGEDVN